MKSNIILYALIINETLKSTEIKKNTSTENITLELTNTNRFQGLFDHYNNLKQSKINQTNRLEIHCDYNDKKNLINSNNYINNKTSIIKKNKSKLTRTSIENSEYNSNHDNKDKENKIFTSNQILVQAHKEKKTTLDHIQNQTSKQTQISSLKCHTNQNIHINSTPDHIQNQTSKQTQIFALRSAENQNILNTLSLHLCKLNQKEILRYSKYIESIQMLTNKFLQSTCQFKNPVPSCTPIQTPAPAYKSNHIFAAACISNQILNPYYSNIQPHQIHPHSINIQPHQVRPHSINIQPHQVRPHSINIQPHQILPHSINIDPHQIYLNSFTTPKNQYIKSLV